MPSINNVFRLVGNFQQGGVAADPGGSVAVTYVDPTGKSTTVGPFTVASLPQSGMTHDSAGVIHLDIVPTVLGRWKQTWSSGAGAGQSSQTTTFVIEGAPATYASVPDIRAYGIDATLADDATVADKLEIASRSIDDFCGLNTPNPQSLPSFGTTVTKTILVTHVDGPYVKLPFPFSAVTRVNISGVDIPPTLTSTVAASPAPTTSAFAVAPGDGVKIAFDHALVVDGMDAVAYQVVSDLVSLTVPLASAPVAGHTVTQYPWIVLPAYGLQLQRQQFLRDVNAMVTATLGYAAVPSPARQACILITVYLLNMQGQEVVDPRVQALMVEGYQVRYDRSTGRPGPFALTTGVPAADELLRRYRADTWMVA